MKADERESTVDLENSREPTRVELDNVLATKGRVHTCWDHECGTAKFIASVWEDDLDAREGG